MISPRRRADKASRRRAPRAGLACGRQNRCKVAPVQPAV